MIDLRLLKTFLTVLETGTYSQAAVKLDYAQSTVTKHMQLLEGAYHGTKLLRRQGARMVPTAEGLALQRYAEQILQLYEASCRDIAPRKSGSSASAPPTRWRIPICRWPSRS